MKIIYTSLVVSAMLVSCTSVPENNLENPKDLSAVIESSGIKRFENIEDAKVNFTIDAQSGGEIELENGGSIIFDENAFVDINGDPITGEVDVEWQEFHTLGDILLSGIPMKYDSAGVDYDLTSGGMFTIDASKDGKEVNLAKGKKAQVNLASLKDTPCYNFYEIDEKSGNWNYQTTKSGTPIEQPKPEPQKSERKQSVIDVQLDTKKFAELNELDIMGWKTKEVIPRKKERLLSSASSMTRLIKKESGVFAIEVKIDQYQEEYEVTPYLMEEAIADSKANMAELKKHEAEMKEYVERVASGKVIRSIAIDDFGTYNWDIVNKRENSQRVVASFDYPENASPKFISLFLVSPDESVIVRYDAGGDEKFSFDPKLRNCLVAITADNDVYAVSNRGFADIRGKANGTFHTFVFKKTGKKLKSARDMDSHIESLI